MSDQDSEFNFKPLDNLIKALVSKQCTVKIGILGNKDARKPIDGESGSTSNATVGAAQEHGTSKIPRRSFLRMPIAEHLPGKLKDAGLLDKKHMEDIIKNGSFKEYTRQIGTLGVATVLEAFDTGGFGTWPELSQARLKQRAKKNQGSQILVVADSHQLRDSIDFRVEEKS